METFIALAIAFIVVFVLKLILDNYLKSKTTPPDEPLPEVYNEKNEKVSPTRVIKGFNWKVLFYESEEKVIVTDHRNRTKSFSFKEILKVKEDIKSNTEISRSMGNTAARTLAGGLLFGGVGALVGASTSKSKESIKIFSISFEIVLKAISNNSIVIELYSNAQGTPVNIVEMHLKKLEELNNVFEVILDRNAQA